MLDPRTAQIIKNITQSLGSGAGPRLIVIHSSAPLQAQSKLLTLAIFFIVMILVLLLVLLALGIAFLHSLERGRPGTAGNRASGCIPRDSPRINSPLPPVRSLEARTLEQRPGPADPARDSPICGRLLRLCGQLPDLAVAVDAKPRCGGPSDTSTCSPDCSSPASTLSSRARSLVQPDCRDQSLFDTPRNFPQPLAAKRDRRQSSD